MAQKNDLAIVSTKILIDGSPINSAYSIFEINVTKEVNRIASARIKVIDGSASKEDFKISDGKDFDPGKEIDIQSGFGLKTKSIFKGIIISQSLKASTDSGSFLIVECKDKATKMTIGASNSVFSESRDSDVIKKLISNHGLSAEVKETESKYPQIVQYYSTDWDFIISRAEVNGLIVVTSDGKVEVEPPKVGGETELSLTYGNDIVEFDTVMDARTQYSGVEAQAWDYKTQSILKASSSNPSAPSQGNISGSKLAKVTNSEKYNIQTTVPLNSGELKSWADSYLLKSRLAKIQGKIKAFGQANLVPNKLVKLNGLGERFNGNAFVSGIKHEISKGNWWTIVSIGLDPNWFASTIDISSKPASALLPGIRGLQNGIVKKIDEDPLGETRVQVEVPMFKSSNANGILWARWAQPYATENAGQFFMPELEDEVVLGFLNEDPRYPVILGSLYSSKKTPPYEPKAENPMKAIVSKNKLTLEFDDENKVITIKTPGGNQIQLTDQDQGLVLQDQNSNKITLNADGVSMQSPSNIEIKADGEVSISGTGGVSISSSAEVSISGEAEASLSGGEVTISGTESLTVTSGANAAIVASLALSLLGEPILIN